MSRFVVGKNYCLFIPPGWIIVGKIASVDDKSVVLADSFYLENVDEGVGALALGLVANLEKAVTKSWPLPDGVGFDIHGILISSPCDRDITKLSLSHVVGAIKGRK